jgi:hypothetical protein
VKDGTVTAGNAPGLNDGASALVVTSLAFARTHGLTPMARITAYATGGGEPKDLFFAPILAVQNLMKKAGTSIGAYDLIEANEAFAVQALANGRALGWDWDRVNVSGGAIALGHPIGASGARVLTTLLYGMKARGAKTGLATLCLGGGNAVAPERGERLTDWRTTAKATGLVVLVSRPGPGAHGPAVHSLHPLRDGARPRRSPATRRVAVAGSRQQADGIRVPHLAAGPSGRPA